MIIVFSFAAVLSTLLGGLFALRFKDKLHLILGFSAGAVLGAAFFDLIPEALELASESSANSVMVWVAIGFITYLIISRSLAVHGHDDEQCHNHRHQGILGAGSLTVHCFLDGIAIGLAFQASSAVGITVATAVLIHKFSDGINTVALILRGGGTRKVAAYWLTLAGVAPIFGVVSTLFFTLSSQILGLILAIFAGFFIYIGASDLIPESHHEHSAILTTLMVAFGFGLIYLILRIAGV